MAEARVLYLPPITAGVPKSATERIKDRIKQIPAAGFSMGSTTRLMVWAGEAPKSLDASRRRRSSFSRIPTANRAFKEAK